MKVQALSLMCATMAATTVVSAPVEDSITIEDQSRNLASLKEKWNLTEPEFTYDANTFSLTFPVTNFINSGMANYSLWTAPDCQEGNVPLDNDEAWESKSLTESAALLAANVFSGDGKTQLDSGDFVNRSATINAKFDSSKIFDASFYQEFTDATTGKLSAQVQFCIRFGLWTVPEMGIDGDGVEVNFLETVITLTVDLTDGFNIDGITVTPKERLVRTANVAYLVDGYECDADNKEITDAGNRNQGDVIRICVTPETDAINDGLYMRSIDSFTWKRTVTDGADIEQDAIVDKDAATNLLTDYSPAACRGTRICHFESILFADFFFSTGPVTGEGVATLQFGTEGVAAAEGRKLRGERAGMESRELQAQEEPAASEFDLNVSVNQAVARSTSGAVSSAMGAAMSLVVMAGTVMAL